MWAQLITMRLKPGKEEELPRLYEQLRAAEQPGSGLVRTSAARCDKDPSRLYHFVIFESEEKARARRAGPGAPGGARGRQSHDGGPLRGTAGVRRPDGH